MRFSKILVLVVVLFVGFAVGCGGSKQSEQAPGNLGAKGDLKEAEKSDLKEAAKSPIAAMSGKGNDKYDEGYQSGSALGQEKVEMYNAAKERAAKGTGSAAQVAVLHKSTLKIANDLENRVPKDWESSYGGQGLKGMADGYRIEISKGGIK